MQVRDYLVKEGGNRNVVFGAKELHDACRDLARVRARAAEVRGIIFINPLCDVIQYPIIKPFIWLKHEIWLQPKIFQ